MVAKTRATLKEAKTKRMNPVKDEKKYEWEKEKNA